MASKVLVYGGRGALGSSCVEHFKSLGYWVCSFDLHENTNADASVVIQPNDSLSSQSAQVLADALNVLGSDKVDAVVCVAGGWAGGNSSCPDYVKNIELVTKQSVFTSVIASQLAVKFGKPESLLLLTGADPALKGTPGMIGYGMMKAAVHHLTASLAKDPSLPEKSTVLAILPVTLDTPMNRKFMPKADQTTWTPLSYVAELITNWMKDVTSRPKSGSLVRLHTAGGKTETKVIQQE